MNNSNVKESAQTQVVSENKKVLAELQTLNAMLTQGTAAQGANDEAAARNLARLRQEGSGR